MPFIRDPQQAQQYNPLGLTGSAYTPEQHQKRLESTEAERAPLSDIFAASFNQHNMLTAYAAKYANLPSPLTPEEKEDFAYGLFDPMDFIPEDWKDDPAIVAEYLEHATSPRHANWVTQNILRMKNEREIEAANPWWSLMTGISAVAISPETVPMYFIPGSVALRAGTAGSKLTGATITGSVAREAGIAGTFAAIGEYGLHEIQPTRTKEESYFAVGGSVLLTSALTGTIGRLRMRGATDDIAEVNQASRAADKEDAEIRVGDDLSVGAAQVKYGELDELPEVLQREITEAVDNKIRKGELDEAQRAGEIRAETERRLQDLSKVKHPRIYRTLGWVNPSVRLATSQVSEARILSANLVDDPLSRNMNTYGMTTGPSIELLADQMRFERWQSTSDILSGQYRKYVESKPDKKMTYDQFADEVGKAMREGDVHTNNFVQTSAKGLRSSFSDIEARLVANDMIPKEVRDFNGLKRELVEDVNARYENVVNQERIAKWFDDKGDPVPDINKRMPKALQDFLVADGHLKNEAKVPPGDKSYMYRKWDFGAIENDPQGFVREIQEIITEQHTAKLQGQEMAMKARLDELRTLTTETEIKKAQPRTLAQIAKEKAQLKKLNAELAELRTKIGQETVKARPNKKKVASLKSRFKEVMDERRVLNKASKDIPRAVRELENELDAIQKNNADFIKRELERQAKETAIEVKNKIIGDDWIRQGNVHSFTAGPLKYRTFNIPSNRVAKWLKNNAEEVWGDYIDKVAPNLLMKENLGDTAAKTRLDEVRARYDEMIDAAPTQKAATKLEKEKTQTMRDLQAMIESLHGRYKRPDAPDAIMNKTAQRLREINFMSLLGMMTISALPDLGNIIARHGLWNVVKGSRGMQHAFTALAKDINNSTLPAQKLRAMGTAIDFTNNVRAERLAMLDNNYNLRTRTDRMMHKATSKFSKYTGMNHWNAHWKTFAGLVYQNDLIQDALKTTSGRLSQKKITAYARNGLSENDLKAIAVQLRENQKAFKTKDGFHYADVEKWVDADDLIERYKAALIGETEKSVVTPGFGDMPLMSRGELGRLVFQFKSFSIAAHNRMVLASIDQFGMEKVSGILSMIVLGAMAQAIRDKLRGKETMIPESEDEWGKFLKNAIDRSGYGALLWEVNGALEKVTRGQVGLLNWLDKEPIDRYASRNLLSSILGPSAGRVQDIGQITGAISSGEWRETDARAIRRLIPYNNIFYLYRVFNKMEEAMGGPEYGPLGEIE